MDREQKPLLLTQGEALALLGGIGRTKLWDLVNHGEIVRVNVGRRAGRRCGRRARGHGVPPRSSSRAGRGGFPSADHAPGDAHMPLRLPGFMGLSAGPPPCRLGQNCALASFCFDPGKRLPGVSPPANRQGDRGGATSTRTAL